MLKRRVYIIGLSLSATFLRSEPSIPSYIYVTLVRFVKIKKEFV